MTNNRDELDVKKTDILFGRELNVKDRLKDRLIHQHLKRDRIKDRDDFRMLSEDSEDAQDNFGS